MPVRLGVGVAVLVFCVTTFLGVPRAAYARSAGRAQQASRAVRIMCFESSGQPVARTSPAACDVFGEPEDEADLIRLSRARWTGWGGPVAHASAVALANKPLEAGPVSVSVTLSSPRRRCGGRLFYTRLTAVRTSGSSDWFNANGTRTLMLSGACHAIPF
jgi:hypothetical protein